MSPPSIYTELLLNIRQVTVFVTLPSNWNETTKLGLSPDKRLIYITHDKEYAETELPCQLTDNGYLKPPSTPVKELSFRLPVHEDRNTLSKTQPAQEDDYPWPACSMTTETPIGCRSCLTILSSGSIKAWKALPSENWAEMMDFWHCHKPDVEEPQKYNPKAETKGYAASNRLGPIAGIGLVDVTSFVLLRDDCVNIKNNKYTPHSLVCKSCGGPLGVDEEGGRCARLYKWNLCLRHGKNAAWQTLPVQRIICAKLLALIEGQATYKFLVYSGEIEDAQAALTLWVFTPDMMYSATARQGGSKRAMKIFYKMISKPAPILEEQGTKVEELQLPDHVLSILHADLKASAEILPSSARKLQDWEVGLLQR